MRSICVLTGLVGTFYAPYSHRKIGLVRTGSWSLWILLIPLVPTIVALYVGVGPGKYRPAWNTALLFSGLAISRVGLWSFDLTQLQLVQVSRFATRFPWLAGGGGAQRLIFFAL